LIISFKFSIFTLKIEHPILKELGEFTLFSLKAIDDNLSIFDISNIVQIQEEIVKRQLSFALSRKYLNENYTLTEKGRSVVHLFNFINSFNTSNIEIALEHCIENGTKKIYFTNNINLTQESKGILVSDKLYDYKVINKFQEIKESEKTKFLIEKFSDYKSIINNYSNDFLFKLEKDKEKTYFYNYEVKDSLEQLVFSQEKEKGKDYISVSIPILEVKKTITSQFVDEAFTNNLESRFDNFRYFNLFNGKNILSDNIEENSKIKADIKLSPMISETDIVRKYQSFEKFLIDELLFVDMKTEVKNITEIKFLNITNILENL